MTKLSFDQRMVLFLYPIFFQDNYAVSSGGSPMDNQDKHVQAQKMCYLLKLHGTEVGDFDYAWNVKGPFSPGLLALLRTLDSNAEDVRAFYESSSKQQPPASTQSTLSTSESNEISQFAEALKLNLHSNRLRWIELLGSLAFISNVILPGAPFALVSNRLKEKKPHYNSDKENREAWDTLLQTKLLSTVS